MCVLYLGCMTDLWKSVSVDWSRRVSSYRLLQEIALNEKPRYCLYFICIDFMQRLNFNNLVEVYIRNQISGKLQYTLRKLELNTSNRMKVLWIIASYQDILCVIFVICMAGNEPRHGKHFQRIKKYIEALRLSYINMNVRVIQNNCCRRRENQIFNYWLKFIHNFNHKKGGGR